VPYHRLIIDFYALIHRFLQIQAYTLCGREEAYARLSYVEVDELGGLVRYEAAEVAADEAVPPMCVVLVVRVVRVVRGEGCVWW
jgi:hypothetical protein